VRTGRNPLHSGPRGYLQHRRVRHRTSRSAPSACPESGCAVFYWHPRASLGFGFDVSGEVLCKRRRGAGGPSIDCAPRRWPRERSERLPRACRPEGLADSLSELPEARLVTSPELPKEILVSNDPPPTSATAASGTTRPGGFVYPEWDYRTGTYQEHGAVVREHPAPLGQVLRGLIQA
jgi:hypothetical protein